MPRRARLAAIAAAVLLASTGAAAGAAAPVAAVPHSPGKPYAARNLADRIVLTPGADPAREVGIAFRTDTAQAQAEVEIAPAIAGPRLDYRARTIVGETTPLVSENGTSHYHRVRLAGLQPDTPYVYRVRGSAGWSEWFQFRTAAAEFRPFRFLYFGDTQNSILSIGSRVIRQAFRASGEVALALHAGDLVAQRDDMVHDDEWGEWHDAGSYNFSIVPQVPAAGNHEYVDDIQPDGSERRRLGPHWTGGFALPGNGADAARATTYFTDYQGVRFIVLDGTAALDLGALGGQTAWLEATLRSSPARWNVVLFHQPIFTCARPNDTPPLKAAWKPIFEKYNVDLVLQGHDHCYGRLTAEAGSEAGRAARAAGKPQGPVYVVSVTGAKMYGLNDRAMRQPDRVAEDTELYQLIDVEADRLRYRAHTATGELYDAFDLERLTAGGNRLTEPLDLPTIRRCSQGTGPDGAPCSAEPKD